MSRRKKSGVDESFFLSKKTENFYRNRLMLLAVNAFKWEGLPEGMPELFIERSLYNTGLLAFAMDPIVGLICCKAVPSGDFNMYDEALYYELHASNGYSQQFKKDDIVLLRNNKLEIPTSSLVDYYIEQLFEFDRTIQTNVKLQKISNIICCDESQRLTLENLLMQYEGNVPFIFGNKNLDLSALQKTDLNVPYVARDLYELRKDIWRDCLDTIGINNANTDKKERMITGEVNSNNQLIELSGDIFLESRELCCSQVFEKWGHNMSVERRVEIDGDLYGGAGDDNRE